MQQSAAIGYITKKSRESFDTEVKTTNVIGNYSSGFDNLSMTLEICPG